LARIIGTLRLSIQRCLPATIRKTNSIRSSFGKGTSGTNGDADHPEKWGNDIWRIDAALGYRFTNCLQGKVQYSISQQKSAQEGEHLVAVQLTAKY
jgi:hypothetical protein